MERMGRGGALVVYCKHRLLWGLDPVFLLWLAQEVIFRGVMDGLEPGEL